MNSIFYCLLIELKSFLQKYERTKSQHSTALNDYFYQFIFTVNSHGKADTFEKWFAQKSQIINYLQVQKDLM